MKVFPWAPTVDGNFLIDTPYNMLKTGQFQKKEALLGVNRDEGTFWILFVLPGFSKDGPSPQNLSMFNSGVDTIAWDLTADQVGLVRYACRIGIASSFEQCCTGFRLRQIRNPVIFRQSGQVMLH